MRYNMAALLFPRTSKERPSETRYVQQARNQNTREQGSLHVKGEELEVNGLRSVIARQGYHLNRSYTIQIYQKVKVKLSLCLTKHHAMKT
jgi:hypothetical protein